MKWLRARRYDISWLIGTLMLVGLLLFTTIAVQQAYRTGADDPQTQMVDDALQKLQSGQTADQIAFPDYKVDIAKNSKPYLIIYDGDNKQIVSEAALNNQDPQIPIGVLNAAKKNGSNTVTWQPREGIRQALVLKSYDNGIVVAGRSLKDVEERTGILTQMFFVALVGLLVGSGVMYSLNKPKQ